MKNKDDSLDSTLDRYMGRAGEPPAGQVASSVDGVWERLRPEAEYSTLQTREVVARRSHFNVVVAVLVAVVATGLYAAQRTGLLQAMLSVQQQTPPQVAPASENPAVAANLLRERATVGDVGESKESVAISKPRQPEGAAVTAATRSTPQPLAGDAVAQPTPSPRSGVDSGLMGQVKGQSPLAFEVASIRPIPVSLPMGAGPWTVTNGQFKAGPDFTRDVIALAYEVLSAQVKGGPAWLTREPYDFEARAGSASAGPNQIRVMVKTLLEERFKLAIHRDTEEMTAYTLVVAKNGPKLQDANGGRRGYVNWTGLGQVTFSENTTLGGLTSVLSGVVGAPVLDETGLRGTYNFSLEFTRPNDPRPRQTDSPPDVFIALQEQLGLELRATRRRVEVVVIDHIERPSPNRF